VVITRLCKSTPGNRCFLFWTEVNNDSDNPVKSSGTRYRSSVLFVLLSAVAPDEHSHYKTLTNCSVFRVDISYRRLMILLLLSTLMVSLKTVKSQCNINQIHSAVFSVKKINRRLNICLLDNLYQDIHRFNHNRKRGSDIDLML